MLNPSISRKVVDALVMLFPFMLGGLPACRWLGMPGNHAGDMQ